jgi:hypothetical protein
VDHIEFLYKLLFWRLIFVQVFLGIGQEFTTGYRIST